jgi:hypothetical protein
MRNTRYHGYTAFVFLSRMPLEVRVSKVLPTIKVPLFLFRILQFDRGVVSRGILILWTLTPCKGHCSWLQDTNIFLWKPKSWNFEIF